jgi:hypothetical protein
VLHISISLVAFKVLPLGSYAPMPPTLRSNFGSGFVEWPSKLPLYYSKCHQNAFLSIFPFIWEQKKVIRGLDPVNREGVPA